MRFFRKNFYAIGQKKKGERKKNFLIFILKFKKLTKNTKFSVTYLSGIAKVFGDNAS